MKKPQTRTIDEEKMGSHLANLLRFYEEVKEQSVYSRMLNTILGEQNEAFEHFLFPLNDGMSESQIVNEMFSNISRYVRDRQSLQH